MVPTSHELQQHREQLCCVRAELPRLLRGTAASDDCCGIGCDNNWATGTLATRTQWNIDSQTYIGVDVVYTNLKSASTVCTVNVAAGGNQPAALRSISDQSALMGQFRVHRNFYP